MATEVEHVYGAYKVGAVDYLIKPLEPDVVRGKVATFAELFRQRKEIERQSDALREADRREHALRMAELRVASDKRYRRFVEGVGHVVAWSADPPTLRLSFLSRQAEQVLGCPPEHFSEPDFWTRHLHPDDRELFLSAVREAVAGGKHQACNHRMLGHSGRVLWFQTSVSVEQPLDGTSPEVHGVSTDVTDLKRAEERQQLLAEASRSFAESLDERAILARLARVVVPHLADWSVVEAVGDSPATGHLEVAHADPARAETLAHAFARRGPLELDAACAEARVLRTGRSALLADVSAEGWPVEVFDGDPRTLRPVGAASCVIVPLSARGRVLAVMTCVSATSRRRLDATDLALAEDLADRAALAIDSAGLYEEARRVTLAREELLAVVSHDLKSPLQAITISAERLARADDATPRAKQVAETVHRSAVRMDRLIDDLLDVERIEKGRLALDKKRHDVKGLIRDSLELLAPLAREKSIDLRLEVASTESMKVLCDRDRVLQVLANVVGNAIKFSPEGRAITVRAEPGEEHVRFAVEDHGPGVAPEQLSHVFDRYWQTPPEKTRPRAGLGLGLAIAKGIVEKHGGRIWAESEPGSGAVFFFTLPRAANRVSSRAGGPAA